MNKERQSKAEELVDHYIQDAVANEFIDSSDLGKTKELLKDFILYIDSLGALD